LLTRQTLRTRHAVLTGQPDDTPRALRAGQPSNTFDSALTGCATLSGRTAGTLLTDQPAFALLSSLALLTRASGGTGQALGALLSGNSVRALLTFSADGANRTGRTLRTAVALLPG
jgi:hypothetical protein